LSGPSPARATERGARPTPLQHAALLLVVTAGIGGAWLVSRDEPAGAPRSALTVPADFGVTSLAADAAAAPPQALGAFLAGLPVELTVASEARSEYALAVEAARARATAGASAEPAGSAVTAQPAPAAPPPAAERAEAVVTARAEVVTTEPAPATAPVVGAASQAAAVPAATAAATAPAVPPRQVPLADFRETLARSRWPAELWERVIKIAGCESGTDLDRDGRADVFDTLAVGSGGTTYGVMQVHRGHRFAQPLDLFVLDDNLEAAFVVWERAGGSFAPWGCR
jgi:hypothetical protein